MKPSTKIILICIVIILLPVIIKLQMVIDPQRAQFQPGRGVASVVTEFGSNPVVLPSQFVFGTVIGFREVVAGLLWVRANDFFHTGNYDAIVPLSRMITWLDPHQLVVYSVGAWHLAYNFVDFEERADRRYLYPGMKFLLEGIQNNSELWDLYFEMGFTMYFLKVLNYDEAAYWLKQAQERGAPGRVQRCVAHALERAGRIDESIAQWKHCIADAKRRLKQNPNDPDASYDLAISKRNYDRIVIQQMERSKLANHPLAVNFEATFRRLGPKQFLISGHTNLPDGARVEVTLTDFGYKEPTLEEASWQVDPNQTLVYDTGIHGIVVRGGRFSREYDLSKDPKQYPLRASKYKLSIFFNPRNAARDIQDIVGWSGEGIIVKNYPDNSVKGLRKIKKVIILKREDII
ncbi:MAG: hypothetical protein K6T99_00345 [Armatimonadetes bacterium]|nr:hypothetical protein [Armatimonadota bacterium]